jgi:hypothetical protein
MEIEKIALFDLDGTLCDYESSLLSSLNELNSPEEPRIKQLSKKELAPHLQKRMDLIRSSVNWWANLPRFELGFTIWKLAEDLGFRRMVLTQGPKRNPNAWSGKKIWIDKNLGPETEITITRDKGLVYGKILVDDWPEYIERWLKWRPRGLVIMPASSQNKKFKHKQVIRYDGSNLQQVAKEMEKVAKK